MPGHCARAYARAVLARPDRRPTLDNTPATQRIRRWARLREQLLGHENPPGPSAESVARWVDSHPTDPVAGVIRATAARDRLIAPLPYDGFSPGLDEDPWPLYRALADDDSPKVRKEAGAALWDACDPSHVGGPVTKIESDPDGGGRGKAASARGQPKSTLKDNF